MDTRHEEWIDTVIFGWVCDHLPTYRPGWLAGWLLGCSDRWLDMSPSRSRSRSCPGPGSDFDPDAHPLSRLILMLVVYVCVHIVQHRSVGFLGHVFMARVSCLVSFRIVSYRMIWSYAFVSCYACRVSYLAPYLVIMIVVVSNSVQERSVHRLTPICNKKTCTGFLLFCPLFSASLPFTGIQVRSRNEKKK